MATNKCTFKREFDYWYQITRVITTEGGCDIDVVEDDISELSHAILAHDRWNNLEPGDRKHEYNADYFLTIAHVEIK